MADIFTVKKRSQIMASIKSSGTQPEQKLFGILSKIVPSNMRILKYPRLNGTNIDAVITPIKVAIFCDGCFYHSCATHGHIPKSNIKYWEPKLKKNKRRDVRLRRMLRSRGYKVWRVWEHDLRRSALNHTRKVLQNRILKYGKKSKSMKGTQLGAS